MKLPLIILSLIALSCQKERPNFQKAKQDYQELTVQPLPFVDSVSDPDQRTANRAGCQTMYNNTRSGCANDYQLQINSANTLSNSGSEQAAATVRTRARKQYNQCVTSAIADRDHCLQNQNKQP